MQFSLVLNVLKLSSLAFKEGRLVSSFCLEKDRLKNDVKNVYFLPSDSQKNN
jgi:hypothetical protein